VTWTFSSGAFVAGAAGGACPKRGVDRPSARRVTVLRIEGLTEISRVR
jgi:hypothetical protein